MHVWCSHPRMLDTVRGRCPPLCLHGAGADANVANDHGHVPVMVAAVAREWVSMLDLFDTPTLSLSPPVVSAVREHISRRASHGRLPDVSSVLRAVEYEVRCVPCLQPGVNMSTCTSTSALPHGFDPVRIVVAVGRCAGSVEPGTLRLDRRGCVSRT